MEGEKENRVQNDGNSDSASPTDSVAATIVEIENQADTNQKGGQEEEEQDDSYVEERPPSGFKAAICACFKTLLGPKAPSCLWCCCCCNYEKSLICSYASTATKVMNLVLMLSITALSCFFIIPTVGTPDADPDPADAIAPALFYPCGRRGSRENFEFFEVKGFWSTCKGHAGYFFVYRFFLCLISFYTIMGLITFNISSTKSSSKRASLHHGFWVYKFAIVGGLLIISGLAIRVYFGGYFEMTMMWFGLLGAYFFALIEMVCVLDLLERILIKLKEKMSEKSFKKLYWITTTLNYLIGLSCIATIAVFNVFRNYSKKLKLKISDSESFFNGEDGDENINGSSEKKFCGVHIGILVYALVAGITVTLLMLLAKLKFDARRFRNVGYFQTSLIFLYTIFQSWSAISNSPDAECRAIFFPYNEYKHNKDVTFTPQGCMHGFIAVFAILYYTFSNGPNTRSPWTVAFNKIWYLTTGPPQPPSKEPPKPLHAWNDEKRNVTYSWPLYYIVLILGSFSIMMAMTNYSSPWAESPGNGSSSAMDMKIITSLTCIILFLLPILKACPTIYPESEFAFPPPDKLELQIPAYAYAAGLTVEQLQAALQEIIQRHTMQNSASNSPPPEIGSPVSPASAAGGSSPKPPSPQKSILAHI